MELEIIPAILEHDWAEIERKIELVRPFAKTIHIDLLDGKLVDNTTFLDPTPFAKYTGELFFELHMMVEEPITYVKSFADAGFRRFLGHVEKMSDQAAFVAEAEQYGEVGLALDGPTPLDAIKVSYEDLDSVLFYVADRIGFSGKPLQPDRLEKVKTLRAQKDYLPIEADGGLNMQTVGDAARAGITRFLVTSGLFKATNIEQTYRELLNAATNAVAVRE